MNFQQFYQEVSTYNWQFLPVGIEGNSYNDRLLNLKEEYIQYEFCHDISESLHWFSGCQFSQNHLANYFYLQLRDKKLYQGELNETNNMGYCPTFIYLFEGGYKLTYQTTSGTIIMLCFEDDMFWWKVFLPSDREEGTHHFFLEKLQKEVSEETLQTYYDLYMLEENNELDKERYESFAKEWNEKVNDDYPPTLSKYKTKLSCTKLADSLSEFAQLAHKDNTSRMKKEKARKLIKELERILDKLKGEYPKEVIHDNYEDYEEGLEEVDYNYMDF